MHAATILAQLDHVTDPSTGGLVPSIHPGVTYVRPGSDIALGYARSGNSGAALVETILCQLEGGAVAAAFGAGAAAAQAVLATLRPGDRVLIDTGLYYEFGRMIGAFAERFGLGLARADLCDLDAVALSLGAAPTRLVWAECPSNPLWRVPDLAALAALAHRHGARLLVDATVATPVLCRPLTLGADLVLHSATKYLNGHGDLVAGVLVAAEDDGWWHEMLAAREAHGSILPPFEAWLLLRGMRSLALRMERVSTTALTLAGWLDRHPRVCKVHYPGLPQHPQHGLACRQFREGFGGMLSFELADAAEAVDLCARTRVFRPSTSLGSPESLIEHRLSTEGEESDCPPGLIRLAIGLEHPDDLLADLMEMFRSIAPR
ncbi:PLP-dependent aspartate aminotransferase family protein [Bosea sp. RAF48]|uniref:trans-sulfuration enzyme family protein n=1 Tax=Bosea sp. RAF48 TaxID=3237480 RepID=UPI003F90DB3E